jgi:hypothetical protein
MTNITAKLMKDPHARTLLKLCMKETVVRIQAKVANRMLSVN